MILCNLKPSKLSFVFSRNRRKQKNQHEILYVHNNHQRSHEKILQRYAKETILNTLQKSRGVRFLSIGKFTDPDDWSSEWIEEGFYLFPRS